MGVDGCRFGWIAAFERDRRLDYRLCRTFAELLASFPNADCIFVDIPIGLPWAACPTRPCDALARRLLGKGRAPSVFPAPARGACNASSIGEARNLNIAELGRSLSAQAWGICAKVAEVDTVMRSAPMARNRVREIHPEVCFWGLNGARAMQHSKSTRPGRAERLTLLGMYEPRSQDLLASVMREQLRKDVQVDDVLDALVGFITATAPPASMRVVQGEPRCDQFGLPMEMVYVQGD